MMLEALVGRGWGMTKYLVGVMRNRGGGMLRR